MGNSECNGAPIDFFRGGPDYSANLPLQAPPPRTNSEPKMMGSGSQEFSDDAGGVPVTVCRPEPYKAHLCNASVEVEDQVFLTVSDSSVDQLVGTLSSSD
jgi:hypothetical protein